MEEPEAKCCVPLCKATSGNTKTISFYTFPQKEKLKKEWILALKDMDLLTQINQSRGGSKSMSGLFICSKHFTRDDFETSPEGSPVVQENKVLVKRSLNVDAVPSVFTVKKMKKRRKVIKKKRKLKTGHEEGVLAIKRKKVVKNTLETKNRKPSNNNDEVGTSSRQPKNESPEESEQTATLPSHPPIKKRVPVADAAKLMTASVKSLIDEISKQKAKDKSVDFNISFGNTSVMNPAHSQAIPTPSKLAKSFQFEPYRIDSTAWIETVNILKKRNKKPQSAERPSGLSVSGLMEVRSLRSQMSKTSEALTSKCNQTNNLFQSQSSGTFWGENINVIKHLNDRRSRTKKPIATTVRVQPALPVTVNISKNIVKPPQIFTTNMNLRTGKQSILYAKPERKEAGAVSSMLSDAISKVFMKPIEKGFRLAQRSKRNAVKKPVRPKTQDNSPSDTSDSDSDEDISVVEQDDYIRLPDHNVLQFGIESDGEEQNDESMANDPLAIQSFQQCVGFVKNELCEETLKQENLDDFTNQVHINDYSFVEEGEDNVLNASTMAILPNDIETYMVNNPSTELPETYMVNNPSTELPETYMVNNPSTELPETNGDHLPTIEVVPKEDSVVECKYENLDEYAIVEENSSEIVDQVITTEAYTSSLVKVEKDDSGNC